MKMLKGSSTILLIIISPLIAGGQTMPVKHWDSRFGGSDNELCASLAKTSDGGSILGGWSTSEISGDKSQPFLGSYDYWILKSDANGVKQWDVTFGGSSNDQCVSIQQTTDGGYILGGYSQSGISTDKSQA